MIHLKEFINGNFEHFKHVFHTSYYLNFDSLNLTIFLLETEDKE